MASDHGTASPKTNSGRRVYKARYSLAENDTWLDNPLIEALPRLLTPEQFMEAACFLPPHHEEMRKAPSQLRLTYIERVLQFFIPLKQHVLLEQRFARILRDGYVARNPLADLGWSRLHQQLDNLTEALKYGVAPYEPPSTLGFTIIGTAGVGKTTAMDAVLRTYPQAIVHHSYTDSSEKEHQLARTQIVYVKLNCPEDATLKSLCLSFFHSVDRITGITDFYKEYGFRRSESRTATNMLPDMARVAALFSVGVLIVDEIQFLNKQKSGGREQMLQWFTRLTNEINLPVILIGTPRAREVLNGAFWQRRRNAGQGEFYWKRMEQDEEWQRFLRALWRYEFVRNPTPLVDGKHVPQELSNALYEESLGIADLAVRMFMIAQEGAINSGKERLTPELIEKVAANDFAAVREIVQGIKKNDSAVQVEVDDIILKLERRAQDRRESKRTAPDSPQRTSQSASERVCVPMEADVRLIPVLAGLAQEARERGEKVPQALMDAGYIASPTEFGV